MSRLLVRFAQHALEVWPARLLALTCNVPRQDPSLVSYRNLSPVSLTGTYLGFNGGRRTAEARTRSGNVVHAHAVVKG